MNDRKYRDAPHARATNLSNVAVYPLTKKSLERNIRSLSERLEIDAPAWNEIEERRAQKIRQEMELRKAREKDRGFDIGW